MSATMPELSKWLIENEFRYSFSDFDSMILGLCAGTRISTVAMAGLPLFDSQVSSQAVQMSTP